MRVWNWGLRLAAMAVLGWSLAGGSAWADKDGHGGDRGGGDRGGGDHASAKSDGGGKPDGGGRSHNDGGGAQAMKQGGGSDRGQSSHSQNDQPKAARSQGDQHTTFFRGSDNDDRDSRTRGDNDRHGDANQFDQFRNKSNNDHSDNDRDRSGRDSKDSRRTADRIRNDWNSWDRKDMPFRSNWWDNQHGNWSVYSPWQYSRWRDRPNYWWGWTPAGRLATWVVFDNARPAYWDYGPNGNIYYRDGYVYYDKRQYLPVDDYYQQIYTLAHNVPEIDKEAAEQMDWAPLGVFAVSQDGQSDGQRVMQLAINRDGVISGTYFNRENGETHPLTGRVDKRNQRAAWAFADGEHKETVFESSLYNLTKPESSMMVHYGSGANDAEVWQLVRLEQPTGSGNSATGQQRPATNRSLP